VKTEFEIWSTFVLSKPRVGSDYKLQEEIGRISDSLKDHWRSVCIEKAGGKDFSVLGPFVAAMYKVTKEEMDIALAECRSQRIVGGREVPRRKMEPKSMPLMSFPWLFEKELGRIATGIDISDDLEDLGLAPLDSGELATHGSVKVVVLLTWKITSNKKTASLSIVGKNLTCSARMLILKVFLMMAISTSRESHDFTMGDSGELVLATEFQIDSPDPEHLRSGTGVEDVVPRTILDGFDDPREMRAYEYSNSGPSYFNNQRRSPSPNANNVQGTPPTASMSTLITTPTSPSTADFITGTAEEETVKLSIKESALEKLAKLVDSPFASDVVNSAQDAVREEAVGVDIKGSPSEKLIKLVGELTSEATHPEADDVEEEAVQVEVKESALEKLARMMGS
jgi:RNA-dependent RNA polymerase